MWSSLNERLGCRRCSPAAFFLHELGFVLLVASAAFLVACTFLAVRQVLHSGFSPRVLLLGALPAALLLAAFASDAASTLLLKRKGFVYDHDSDRCTWNGEREQ